MNTVEDIIRAMEAQGMGGPSLNFPAMAPQYAASSARAEAIKNSLLQMVSQGPKPKSDPTMANIGMADLLGSGNAAGALESMAVGPAGWLGSLGGGGFD